MKQRYYSNLSDENMPLPPAEDQRPPLPSRTPLSPPDEAEEHPSVGRPENVKRTSYFPLQPPAQGQDASKVNVEGAKSKPVQTDISPPTERQASQTLAATDQSNTEEAPQGLHGQNTSKENVEATKSKPVQTNTSPPAEQQAPRTPAAHHLSNTKEATQGLHGQDASKVNVEGHKSKPVQAKTSPLAEQQAPRTPAAPIQGNTKKAPQGLHGQPVNANHPPPPQRHSRVLEGKQEPQPHATWQRSPTTLTAFIIPFPKPRLPPVGAHTTSQLIPPRFMIYTPPSPPFIAKPSGESKFEAWRKEGISHFCRRKWYEELREAKMRQPKNGKTTKWKRAKWRATKGTDWGINKTKSTNLEFLNRVARLQDESDEKAEDVYRKVPSPEEIVLLHAPEPRLTIDGSHDHDDELLRENFTASLLRTKKRAVRDTLISALLFAPAIVLDTLAVPIWPFGGLAEIDAVWLYASFRGLKTSHTITKRLSFSSSSSSSSSNNKPDQLTLTLAPFPKMDVLERYLAARCHDADPKLFPEYVATPPDTEVLKAMGWKHSVSAKDGGGAGELGWEDRQWESQQVKDDLERCFGKAAREWTRWCKRWMKDPEKAVKK